MLQQHPPLKPTSGEYALFGLAIVLVTGAATLIVIFDLLWMQFGVSWLDHMEVGTQATALALIMLVAAFAILAILAAERELRRHGWRMRFSGSAAPTQKRLVN